MNSAPQRSIYARGGPPIRLLLDENSTNARAIACDRFWHFCEVVAETQVRPIIEVDRKWTADCQNGAFDHYRTSDDHARLHRDEGLRPSDLARLSSSVD
jgi:hypothetical protein